MKNVDLKAITQDVSDRLLARQNGMRMHVEPEKCYASAATVYIFVAIDDGGGRHALDLIRLFESVEKETSERFEVDVMVLPSPPGFL